MNVRGSVTRLSMLAVAVVLAILGVFLFDVRIDEDEGLETADTTPELQSDVRPTSTIEAEVAGASVAEAPQDQDSAETIVAPEDSQETGEVEGEATASAEDQAAGSASPAATDSSQAQAPTTAAATEAAASGKPVIHLTFDDGPSELTPRVMDLLDRYNAKGTFFVMGQAVEQHPEIAKQIVARGHAIANHSYDHMDWRQAGAREDIIRTQEIIKAQTGVTPSCARPPFGADSPQLIETLASQGMASWRWDLATEDHDHRKFLVEQTLNTIPQVQKIWGSEGKIILQHDSDLLLGPSIDGLEAWLANNADKYEFKVIDNCLNYQ